MDHLERRQRSLAGQLSIDFVLEAVLNLARVHDYDFTQTLIFGAIWRANINDQLGNPMDSGGRPWPLADDKRRRVSILEISGTLRMPYETARRQVNRLIERGFCMRDDAGLYIPLSVLVRPELIDTLMANYDLLLQLVSDGVQGGLTRETGAVQNPIRLADLVANNP